MKRRKKKLTPSEVKNLMRRGLRLLIDPEPGIEERNQVFAFFEYHCAYCNTPIEEGKGDLDHLLSAAKGGRNHISNRVLSCKPCNSVDKKEKDWEEFLLWKYGHSSTLGQQRRKILDWIKTAGDIQPLSSAAQQLLEEQCRVVTEAYDEACRKVRNSQIKN